MLGGGSELGFEGLFERRDRGRLVALRLDLLHGEGSPPSERPRPLTCARVDLPWTRDRPTLLQVRLGPGGVGFRGLFQ